MTEETKTCPIMSRPRGWYPATSKEVKVCHHCGKIERVETSSGICPLVWHDEYPCTKDKCMAWEPDRTNCGKYDCPDEETDKCSRATCPDFVLNVYAEGYCKLIETRGGA